MGRPYLLYTVQGGGHSWPGGKPMLEWWVGPTSREIDATGPRERALPGRPARARLHRNALDSPLLTGTTTPKEFSLTFLLQLNNVAQQSIIYDLWHLAQYRAAPDRKSQKR